jgi:3-oxoacyl-[acyl-carrier protein] reductase
MDLQLQGKTCLITGASKGIGYGAAKVLAAEGVRVAVLARRDHLLQALADEIAATGTPRPVVIAAAVTELEASTKIRDAVYETLGRVDILVNSAGGSRPMPWDSPEAQWTEGMTVNFTALRRLTTALLPKMLVNKEVQSTGDSHEPCKTSGHRSYSRHLSHGYAQRHHGRTRHSRRPHHPDL